MDWQLDFLCCVAGSTHSSVWQGSASRRKTFAGHTDSEQAEEQGDGAGKGGWDGHKGSRLAGKVGPRRWGSGIGCCCMFHLGTIQVGSEGHWPCLTSSFDKSNCRGARNSCQAAADCRQTPNLHKSFCSAQGMQTTVSHLSDHWDSPRAKSPLCSAGQTCRGHAVRTRDSDWHGACGASGWCAMEILVKAGVQERGVIPGA